MVVFHGTDNSGVYMLVRKEFVRWIKTFEDTDAPVGYRKSACECPIARYLELGKGVRNVAVGETYYSGIAANGKYVNNTLPEWAIGLVRRVDCSESKRSQVFADEIMEIINA